MWSESYTTSTGASVYVSTQQVDKQFGEPVGQGIGDTLSNMLTYVIIFTNFIPISLLVTIDMVKFFQKFTIQWDLSMYFPDLDRPCLVRSSELNESLGQVRHIFSDKTGTLTCNRMEFRKCSIGGRSYGLGTTQIGRGVLERAGLPIPPEPVRAARPLR